MPATNEAPASPSAVGTLSSAGPTTHMPAYLGPSVKVKGQITGDEDLKVDGNVDGPISLGDHRFTAGPHCQLVGDISAREIVIYGDVKGNLRARDRIEIKKDASVTGELTTARIMIEDGACFKGSVEIERGTAKTGTDLGVDPSTRLAIAEKDFKLKSIRTAGSGQ